MFRKYLLAVLLGLLASTSAFANITITETSNGNYTVSWPQPGTLLYPPSNYTLRESTDGGTTWEKYYIAPSRSMSFTNKAPGTYTYDVHYCYRIPFPGQTFCLLTSQIDGWPYGTVTVAAPKPIPATPTLTVPSTDSDGGYQVSWSASDGAASYALDERTGTTWTRVYSGSARVYSASGKTDGTYAYRVKACNTADKCSAFSSAGSVTVTLPPAAPTLTVPSRSTSGSYTVSWTASTGATSYQLQETDDDNDNWAQVYSGTARKYSVTSKRADEWRYRVRACKNTNLCSAWSGTSAAKVPPATPTISAPSNPKNNEYRVSWTASADAKKYVLEERIGSTWSKSYGTAERWYDFRKVDGTYGYRVKACVEDDNCSNVSSTVEVTVFAPPGTPSLGLVKEHGQGAYRLTWSSMTGATRYELEQRLGVGGNWSQVYSGTATRKNFTLDVAGGYTYRVRACKGTGTCSDWSNEKSIVIPPSKPTLSVPATSDDGDFTVTWTSASGATKYVLEEQSGGSWTEVYSGSSLSKDFSGKDDGSYAYRVKACEGTTNCSGYSSTGSVTVLIPIPPPPVPNLSAPTGSNDGDYTVSWTASSGATSYVLEESSGSAWKQAYSGSGRSKRFTGKDDGSYVYRVKACKANSNCSDYSDTAEVEVALPPSAPTLNAPAASNDGSFQVSWTSPSGATSYVLEERSGSNWTQVYAGAATSQSISGKTDGTYDYRAKACKASNNCSGYSNIETVTVSIPIPPPPTPTLSAPSSSDDGNYTVSWSSSSGAVSYVLEERTATTWRQAYSGSSRSRGFTGKVDGTYGYRVKACKAGNNCSDFSGTEEVVVTLPPPPTPTISVPSDSDDGDYRVTWTASTGATSYVLEERTGSSWSEIYKGSDRSRSISKSANGTYAYRVKACDASDKCSGYSSAREVEVDIPFPAPKLTVPTRSTSGTYTVSWTAVANATRYQLEERAGNGSWRSVYYGTARTRSISSKAAGEYAYRVRACKGSSPCSDWSDTESIKVPPATTTVSAPSDSDDGDYRVSWTASTGATSYVLEERSGASWSEIYKGSSRSQDISKKTDGTYGYRVKACAASDNCSDYSGAKEVEVDIPFPAPKLTVPTRSTSGTYTVSWTAVTGATRYQLEERTGNGNWTSSYSGATLTRSISSKAAGEYAYRVRACKGTSPCSDWSDTESIKVPPATPTVSAPSDSDDGDYRMSWTASTGATSYVLEERSGASWSELYKGSSRSQDISKKTDGTYGYRVKACAASDNCSDYSNEKEVEVDIPFPAPNLTVPTRSTSGTYTVSWTAVTDATRYQLEERTGNGNWTSSYSGTALTRSISNKAAGEYTYRVRACKGTSPCSDWSDTESIKVPPATPTVSAPSSSDDGDYRVSWTASTGATSYVLEERSGASWSEIYNGSSRSQDISKNTDGTYAYRVKACTAASNCSDVSTASEVKVAIPVDTPHLTLPSRSTDGNFTIAWTTPSGATRFELEENPGDGSWTNLYSGGATSRNISAKAAGEYTYRVRACKGSSQCTDWSDTMSIKVSPATPTVSAPSNSDDGDYRVSWTASTGATSYVLEERTGTSWSEIYNGSGRSQAIENKTNGTYAYRVKACAGASNCSDVSTASEVKVVIPAPVVTPEEPNLSVPAISTSGSYRVSWTSSRGATRYLLQERIGAGAWTSAYTGSATQKDVTGKAHGEYTYRVKACKNSSPCSDWSDEATVTVPEVSIETPPSPSIPNPTSLVTSAERNATDKAGTVEGLFRVSERGSATYRIPVMAVPGTAGVTPQVALSYDSQAGNGSLGLGWSVDGLSSIVRCRATDFHDGAAKPIGWNAEDRFCLDGQRLVLTSGTYGSADSEYKTGIDSYVRVTAKGGASGNPDYFEARAKDGSVRYYGNTPSGTYKDAKLDNASGKTFVWSVKRFEDSVGNPIRYDYADGGDGMRIKSISYAYGDQSSQPPAGSTNWTDPRHAHLEFVYENRPDGFVNHVAGLKIATNKRLKRIEVFNHDGSSEKEVREYKLSYQSVSQTSDKRSKLAEVEDCAGGNCLPETSFTWPTMKTGFASRSTGELTLSEKGRGLLDHRVGDFDGDGHLDIVWLEIDIDEEGEDTDQLLRYALSDGSRLQNQAFSDGSARIEFNEDAGSGTLKIEVIDYNADGRADLALWQEGVGDWKVHLSAPQKATGDWRIERTGISTGISSKDAKFADIDGDGLLDAVYVESVMIDNVARGAVKARSLERDSSQAAKSNRGYKFGSERTLYVEPKQDATLFPLSTPSISGLEAGSRDYNGDGRADLVLSLHAPPTLVYPAAFARRVLVQDADGNWGSYATNTNNQKRYAVDLNRDGLADFVREERAAGNISYHAEINTGVGFTSKSLGITLNRDNTRLLEFTDLTGDGFPEFVWHERRKVGIVVTGTVKAYAWNAATESFETNTTLSIRSTDGNLDYSHLFMDVDSDGHADYVHVGNARLNAYPSLNATTGGTGSSYNPAKAAAAGARITRFTNGLGAQTDIEYASLAQGPYERTQLGTTSKSVIKCSLESYSLGPVCEEFTLSTINDTSIATFYKRLNGGWNLPAGTQSLGELGPVLEFSGAMPVVTRVASSAPTASSSSAKSAIEYAYADARVQARGRGFVGFARLTTEDAQTGVRTTTAYRQDFPFAGLPIASESRTEKGHLLSRTTTTWKMDGHQSTWTNTAMTSGTSALGSVRVVPAKVVEETYDLVANGTKKGSLVKTMTTTETRDADGNTTAMSVLTEGGGAKFETLTANTFGPSAADRRLGRLTRTRATMRRDTDANGSWDSSSARTSEFSYYGQSACRMSNAKAAGMLCTETIEPRNNLLKIQTTHSYDKHGNLVRSKVASGGETRCDVDTVSFDSRGRYEQDTFDCLGRKTLGVVTRDVHGQPLKVRRYLNTTASRHVTDTIARTGRGTPYFTGSADGSHTTTASAMGAGARCPSGTAMHTRTRAAGGGEMVACFDRLARKVREASTGFDGTWVYQDTGYDSLGRVARTSLPHYAGETRCEATATGTPQTRCHATLTHDILGRVTRTVAPDGSATSVAHTGLRTVTTNAKGQKRTEVANALGEMVTSTDNLGGIVEYEYDARGNVVRVTSRKPSSDTDASVPARIESSMGYDALDRKLWSMSPEAGRTSYRYNGFGEVVRRENGNGHHTVTAYDGLGRTRIRSDRRSDGTVESNAAWEYDTGATALGMLVGESDSVSGYLRRHHHDSLGRRSETETRPGTGAGTYWRKTTFDAHGRVFQSFGARPSRVYTEGGTRNVFNASGHLSEVRDAVTLNGVARRTHTRITAKDATGAVRAETLGNGVKRTVERDGQTARTRRVVSLSGGTELQDLNYRWDRLGNLESRADQTGNRNLAETFAYDGLNRLTRSTVGADVRRVTHDIHGRIRSKDGEAYTYHGPRPRLLSSAGGDWYRFDAAGNNTAGDGRTIAYTVFDKPSSIIRGAHATRFRYGLDRARFERADTSAGGTTTTLYVGDTEIVTAPDGAWRMRRHIAGLAIETTVFDAEDNQLSQEAAYVLRDHLGSVHLLTGQTGAVLQEMSFDAWGERRSPSTWGRLTGAGRTGFDASRTTRGFTGHEMLDAVGIIHMNGRIHDPRLGMFLQVDSMVQDAGSPSGLNPYAYALGNPLNAVDADGEYATLLVGMIAALSGASAPSLALYVGSTAFLEALVRGANFADALQGGVISGLSVYAAASIAAPAVPDALSLAKYGLAHGAVGGMTSVLRGGRFGHGFLTSALPATFGSSLGERLGGAVGSARAGRVIASAVLGGTASQLTGGKFVNGAATGAFYSVITQVWTDVRYGNTNSGHASEIIKNIPENAEEIFEKGLALAKEMGFDTSRVFYVEEYVFSLGDCDVSCVVKRRVSRQEAAEFAHNNPDYDIWRGSYDLSYIRIYPAATARSIFEVSAGHSAAKNQAWRGQKPPYHAFLNGAESVYNVIAHEIGHARGIGHGGDMILFQQRALGKLDRRSGR